jgi:monoterpene epsilon-lactone hydrolase
MLRHGADASPYFAGADMSDPLVSPARDLGILRRFPPSLLISGTRDPLLSSVLYTHARLVAAGVDADLHVWEGAAHCSFAQPVVDPRVPETQQAWAVIVDFFYRRLGRVARGREP